MSKYPGRIVTDLAPAGYSVFFDGNGDYLSAASNTAFAFGTGDFTMEVWINPASLAVDTLICGVDATSGAILGYSTTTVWLGSRSVSYDLTATYTLQTNTWTHIAVSRQGTTARLFANGVQIASGTVTNNYAQGQFAVGNYVTANIGVNGYLSNVRAVKGTALYTTAFTPPTQLFNITNTSILTCNSPAFVDQSSNAFSLTAAGTPSVSTLTPFTAYVPYNPALGASTPGVWTLDEALQAKGTRRWNMYDPYFNLTTLLLHGNGTNTAQNNTFLDSGTANGGVGFTITRNPASGPNAPTQGSFSPFSQTGWSNHFGSSTSNLKFASDAAFAVGNSNFTVECFVNFTAWASTNQRIFVQGQSGTDNLTIQRDSGANNLVVNIQGSSSISYAWSPNIGQWYHIAVVKSGTGTGQVAVYIDGVSVATGTSSTSISQNQVLIGGIDWASSYNMQGYISNLRYTIGAALYTTNFTPSTTPLTTTSQGATASQVEILTCQSNRFVDNSSNGFSMTVNGTTSTQPFSPFYSTAAYTPATVGGSGYFDGTGDWLSIANNAAFDLGTGDCTVECWLYRATSGTLQGIVTAFPSGGSPINGWGLFINTSNFVYMDSWVSNVEQTFTASDNAIPVNAWTHIAYTRQGGTNRLFVNGKLCTASGTFTQAINTAGFELQIGRSNYGATNYVTGYISNIRIVKGTAVYTAAFTPPTVPLSNITNTSLLLNFTNAGIVDSTAKNALETVGNAQISTTQSRFGGSSMSFDGTGDYLSCPAANAGMNPQSGDFTIECWVWIPSLPGAEQAVVSTMTAGGTGVLFGLAGGGNVNKFQIAIGNLSVGNPTVVDTANFPVQTWTHMAAVRQSGTIYLYKNGVSVGTPTTASGTISQSTLTIGAWSTGGATFNGYLDDIRITRFARYTGNFTPQTSQWQDE